MNIKSAQQGGAKKQQERSAKKRQRIVKAHIKEVTMTNMSIH
jgi:hypothetical protein